MSSTISEYLVTDDLTILLAFISATVFLLGSFYRPQPLVHPILLGRQSDVARVRNPGESAVYRNYGTGLMGRFPLRPHKDVHILPDFVRTDIDAPRTLWDTKINNPRLNERIVTFGTGLLRLAHLQPQESSVLLLLNDCLEFIIADVALATHSIVSFTLSSAALLSPVLDSHPPSAIITHADMLPHVLETIYDHGETSKNHVVIVVGDPSPQVMATVASKVTILKWDDVEREGIKNEKILSPVPKPSDVFTVSFFTNEAGHLQGAQFTHENMTAGVAATRALVPISQGLSTTDTVLSAFPLSTAFGRAIAYTAIFEGTCLASTGSAVLYPPSGTEKTNESPDDILKDVLAAAKKYRIPSPTILFLKPSHVITLQNKILTEAKKSWGLFPIGWRQKLAGIAEGFITKDSLWDRLLFDSARAKVVGDMAGTVRSVVSSGGPLPGDALTPVRIAFSTAFVNTFTHPLVPGPILASHPLDLQDFYKPGQVATAPVGPPSINIEAKLVGVQDETLEKDPSSDPEGVLLVRGPSVGKLLASPMEASYVNIPSAAPGRVEDEGWVGTGVRAKVRTNGAFSIVY